MNFKPAWWLPGKHLQTMGPTLLKRFLPAAKAKFRLERVELWDNDFLDLFWIHDKAYQSETSSQPIVVVLHGLTGGIQSPYASRILKKLQKNNFRAVLMCFRGCGAKMNRLPRCYHSGETQDIQYVIHYLKNKNPGVDIFVVGFSLGGNVLLKWLGETRFDNPIKAAIAISVPFELSKSVDCLDQGFSRIYQKSFLRSLIQFHQKKFKSIPAPIDFGNVSGYKSCREFDNYVTAPLHGFKDAEDYYQKSSCRSFLKDISKPTLIIHALDDPFTQFIQLPQPDEISTYVNLCYTKKGGHVGFVSGRWPLLANYWIDQKIIEFLKTKVN